MGPHKKHPRLFLSKNIGYWARALADWKPERAFVAEIELDDSAVRGIDYEISEKVPEMAVYNLAKVRLLGVHPLAVFEDQRVQSDDPH